MRVTLAVSATWGTDVLWPGDAAWEAFERTFGVPPGPFRHVVAGVPEPLCASDPDEFWESVEDRRRMQTLFGGSWRQFGWCRPWEAVRETWGEE